MIKGRIYLFIVHNNGNLWHDSGSFRYEISSDTDIFGCSAEDVLWGYAPRTLDFLKDSSYEEGSLLGTQH